MEAINVKDFVNSGIFNSEEEVIREALHYLTQAHPEYRIKLAVYRYKTQDISVGRAAELAGVSHEQMKEILIQHGVQLRLGPASVEEAKEEYEVLSKHFAKKKTTE